MTASNGTILMNNTIYRNRGVGIYTTDSGDTAVFNSIIWGNSKSLNVPVWNFIPTFPAPPMVPLPQSF